MLGVAPIRGDEGLIEQTLRVDAAALARVSREMAAATTTEQTIERIVLFATRTWGTQFASVTMLKGRDKVTTIGATSDLVTSADESQYDAGEGPCFDAATESRTISSENLVIDTRWPRWGPQAAQLGFSSVLSAGLHVDGTPIGSLNLYGTKIRQFARGDADMAQTFACHASVALAAIRTVEELQQAMLGRTVIGQAQGILMNRFSIDADRAFGILRRYSNDLNIKLVEVARQLIQTSALPETSSLFD